MLKLDFMKNIMFIILLSGCYSTTPIFYPEKLPRAFLGKEYIQKIDIYKGSVHHFTSDISKDNSDVLIFFVEDKYFNEFFIKTTPKNTNDIRMEFCAYTRGTNISGGGVGCKEYVINIDN